MLEFAMSPEGDPVAFDLILTYMVVDATTPEDGDKAIEDEKRPPDVVEISNPEGVAMLISAIKPLPDTE